MAFDGIVTRAVVRDLNEKILLGKIEKVYQPEADELVFHIHTKNGNLRLMASAGSAHARVGFITENPVNPPNPLAFCMLLRKHLQGARITQIEQKGSERIIEIYMETLNELGFTMSKKLVFEIMGKHSNIILVDIASGKIIDSIKRVGFDVNRVRQLLPGLIYQYPPEQDKVPFAEISDEELADLPANGKAILGRVGGISPALAEELALLEGRARCEFFRGVLAATGAQAAATDSGVADAVGGGSCGGQHPLAGGRQVDQGRQPAAPGGSREEAGGAAQAARAAAPSLSSGRTPLAATADSAGGQRAAAPRVYLTSSSGGQAGAPDRRGSPVDFYPVPLSELESSCETIEFPDISTAMEFFFDKKTSSNQGKQKSHDLIKSVTASLDKMYLKKKRLSEDLLKAENSEDLRLYGELLTANIHLIEPGMKSVEVTNYYDGSTVKIPLDEKLSGGKNAQKYFKRYGKAKTAIKEKQIQLEENEGEIQYLESVLTYLENTDDVSEIEALRSELIETGYVRRRKQNGYKEKKYKPQPYHYTLSNGMEVLVGRNNKENDILTFKTASKGDIWMHTKDIPGSHVIVKTGGLTADELGEELVWEAAAIAAYHSKARTSENVAVDYVPIRYVKKPAGAKPGMVIFTNNRTVYVSPKLPE